MTRILTLPYKRDETKVVNDKVHTWFETLNTLDSFQFTYTM